MTWIAHALGCLCRVLLQNKPAQVATETFLLILMMHWGRFRNPFVCCWAAAKIHVQKGFFPWAEKSVVPFRWKFSLWRSGWQQQNSPRKLLCWQPSHIFHGRRILQACQKWTALTTWLPGGLHFEPFYTQLSVLDTDALELSVELISTYFSVFAFAEHRSYTGLCAFLLQTCQKVNKHVSWLWCARWPQFIWELTFLSAISLLPRVTDQTNQTYF